MRDREATIRNLMKMGLEPELAARVADIEIELWGEREQTAEAFCDMVLDQEQRWGERE